jgi:glycosyltransferase involved in cell wall biosynthesis
MTPTFSVIIPAHNAERTVGNAIGSALAQKVGDLEVLVVDDGSTDGTSSVLERFAAADPRVRHFRQANAGVSAARNRALAEARGSYASLLDSDDALLPGYLETMEETLDRHPDAGFAHCDFWILDDETGRLSTWPLGRLELPADPTEALRTALRRNVFHYGATVRMDVLHEVGHFRSDLRAAEDLELFLRILACGYRAVRAPGRLSVWRSRGGSLSSQTVELKRALAEVHRLVAEEYDVPEDVRELARACRRAELRFIAGLTGERRLVSRLLRVRRTAGAGRRALLRFGPQREWPPEVAAALSRAGSGPRAVESAAASPLRAPRDR